MFYRPPRTKKCIRWSPAACNVARLRHKRDIQMSFTLKIYIQFYVWISAVNVTQNLCRDSSNSTYMFLDSLVIYQCWIRFRLLFFVTPVTLCVYVNAITPPVLSLPAECHHGPALVMAYLHHFF